MNLNINKQFQLGRGLKASSVGQTPLAIPALPLPLKVGRDSGTAMEMSGILFNKNGGYCAYCSITRAWQDKYPVSHSFLACTTMSV